jgi:integrase
VASRSRANIRLDDAVARYIEQLKAEGRSATTIRSAYYGLLRLQLTVRKTRDPNPYLHTISGPAMNDFCYGKNGIRRGTRGQPVAASSFNRYRSVLNIFFEHAVMMQWCDDNPMNQVAASRTEAPTPKLMLNAGELISLLEHTANPVERIGCAIGMNTGLRSNDIRHLTVFDASLAGGTLQTEIRKSRKTDVKPITAELHTELTRWLDTYADATGLAGRGELPDHWLLMPSYRTCAPRARDRRITVFPTQMLVHPHVLVQRPLRRMGYPTKGEGFHTLRRSSARVFFESLRESGEGRDHALMIVQAFLNHADTRMTQRYLGLDQERAIRDTLLRDQPFLSRVAQTEQERVQPETLRKLG